MKKKKMMLKKSTQLPNEMGGKMPMGSHTSNVQVGGKGKFKLKKSYENPSSRYGDNMAYPKMKEGMSMNDKMGMKYDMPKGMKESKDHANYMVPKEPQHNIHGKMDIDMDNTRPGQTSESGMNYKDKYKDDMFPSKSKGMYDNEAKSMAMEAMKMGMEKSKYKKKKKMMGYKSYNG